MVRQVRRRYFLTQRMLAEHLGCSVRTVANWEKGLIRVSYYYRHKLKEVTAKLEEKHAATEKSQA